MSGWTKLFSSITESSVWVEDDKTLRVWVAMLARCNAFGVVEGSIPGMASLCRMSVEDFVARIHILSSPDPYSRNPENEGRRIQEVLGGWLVLNRNQYRDLPQNQDGSRAAYFREYRKKKTPETHNNTVDCCTQQNSVANNTELLRATQEKEKEKEKRNTLRNPDIKIIIDYWFTQFQSKFQKPYLVQKKKDGSLIQSLLQTFPLNDLKSKIDQFFTCNDDFIKKSGYTIGVFYSQINKLSTIKKSRWA